jgi:hypothetical protein
MLYRMEKLIGMSIHASDGEIGKVTDVYFDDHRWAARSLVVETGGWLEARKVLISPIAIESIDWDKSTVQVRLTRQQVKASPLPTAGLLAVSRKARRLHSRKEHPI